MRITIHIDTFDRVSPCGYAILEIDKDARRWVCSSQRGLSLPDEGPLVPAASGTLVCRPTNQEHLCMLEGLDAFSSDGPFEGETGAAMWYADLGIQPVAGHWHVELTEDCESSSVRSRATNEPK
jgi:hypothetical protein